MTQEPIEQPMTIQVSVDWLKWLSIALAVIGFLSLLPLALAKFNHATNICPFNSGMDCELVVRSVYSQIGPLPVSYLGLAGFLLIGLVLLFEAQLQSVRLIAFGMTLFGVAFSGYLIATEAFILHVWCQLCTQIALIMTALFIVSLVRVWRITGNVLDEDESVDE